MVRNRWRVWLRALALGVVAVLVSAVPAHAETVAQAQWHLDALHVAEAHRISAGVGVVVGVVDTGVQADHLDLAGQILDGTRINGPADLGKIDVVGRGTGVAGLIVAKGGGPDHALGIAPGAKVLPVGIHTQGDVPAGILWAVDHGARVVNVPVGDVQATPEEVKAVRYALGHDVVVVAGAGHVTYGGQGATDPYPNGQVASLAKIPGVVVVSATNRSGVFWSGSAAGPEVALSAPGVDITTTASHPGEYRHSYGDTGASSAIVSGVAALVRSKFPDLKAADVINRLIRTADEAGSPGRDPQYGFGRLNLIEALTADVPPTATNPLDAPSSERPASVTTVATGRTSHLGLLLIWTTALFGLIMLASVVVLCIRAGCILGGVNRRGRQHPGVRRTNRRR
jgi:hypothetical protein